MFDLSHVKTEIFRESLFAGHAYFYFYERELTILKRSKIISYTSL